MAAKKSSKKRSSKKWTPTRKPASSPYKGQTIRKHMPHHRKPCDAGQVIHHSTGRCVKRNTPVGRSVEHYKEVYSSKMRGGNKKSPPSLKKSSKKKSPKKKSPKKKTPKKNTPKKNTPKKSSAQKKK